MPLKQNFVESLFLKIYKKIKRGRLTKICLKWAGFTDDSAALGPTEAMAPESKSSRPENWTFLLVLSTIRFLKNRSNHPSRYFPLKLLNLSLPLRNAKLNPQWKFPEYQIQRIFLRVEQKRTPIDCMCF